MRGSAAKPLPAAAAAVKRLLASKAALGVGEASAHALPTAAFVGIVGFGPDPGDVVVEVFFDAVARDHARGPVPFLTSPTGGRGFAERVVQPPRSGVELAVGDVVADAAAVALQLLDLTTPTVAVAAGGGPRGWGPPRAPRRGGGARARTPLRVAP